MFTGKLYEKQIPSAEKLMNRRKMLLAWEQGLGKTVIALAAAEKLFELEKAKHALIIGQSGSYWQWAEQIEALTDSKYVLTRRKDEEARNYRPDPDCRLYITSWHLFRRDYDRLSDYPWDIVIADEAQEFKNNKSKTGQLIKRLNNRIDPTYRWALTGTAISNKLEELYSIMYWVDRGLLPPWPIFEKRHIVRDEFGTITDYRNLKSLHAMLERTRLDRKTHKDFKGQLPKLVKQVHKVEQTKENKEAQSQLLGLLDDMVSNIAFDDEGNIKTNIKNSRVAKAFHKVRETLCPDTKLSYCVDQCWRILEENADNRIIVFSYYKQPLYELAERFGLSDLFFTGDQSTDQKQHNIQRFHKGEYHILLASNAARAGLDLPFANYIINLDVPFSHEVNDQRSKRITRLSSDFNTAVVIYLLMENSIDEFYYKLVNAKGALASAVKEGTADEVSVRPESLRQFIRDQC